MIGDNYSDNQSAVKIRDDISADMTKSLRIQPLGAVKPAKLSVYDASDYSYEPMPANDDDKAPVGNIFNKKQTTILGVNNAAKK